MGFGKGRGLGRKRKHMNSGQKPGFQIQLSSEKRPRGRKQASLKEDSQSNSQPAALVQSVVTSQRMRRISIAGYYIDAMDAPPPTEGAETITYIIGEYRMPRGSRDVVSRILAALRRRAKDRVGYDGAVR